MVAIMTSMILGGFLVMSFFGFCGLFSTVQDKILTYQDALNDKKLFKSGKTSRRRNSSQIKKRSKFTKSRSGTDRKKN